DGLFGDLPVIGLWSIRLTEKLDMIRVFVDIGHSEAAIDKLDQRYGSLEGYRLLLLSVEATLPRLEPAKDESVAAQDEAESAEKPTHRASREELYADIEANYRITSHFLALVALSSIVAGVGLVRDNTAAIIGAMVIAPLLGPNVALALATTLGDVALVVKSLRILAVGTILAFGFAVAGGIFVHVDPSVAEI
ncbi:DUF389 domain-containing protein, partial [bacterium]|nr:DUF389 domain-containing protein [bacterium]